MSQIYIKVVFIAALFFVCDFGTIRAEAQDGGSEVATPEQHTKNLLNMTNAMETFIFSLSRERVLRLTALGYGSVVPEAILTEINSVTSTSKSALRDVSFSIAVLLEGTEYEKQSHLKRWFATNYAFFDRDYFHSQNWEINRSRVFAVMDQTQRMADKVFTLWQRIHLHYGYTDKKLSQLTQLRYHLAKMIEKASRSEAMLGLKYAAKIPFVGRLWDMAEDFGVSFAHYAEIVNFQHWPFLTPAIQALFPKLEEQVFAYGNNFFALVTYYQSIGCKEKNAGPCGETSTQTGESWLKWSKARARPFMQMAAEVATLSKRLLQKK